HRLRKRQEAPPQRIGLRAQAEIQARRLELAVVDAIRRRDPAVANRRAKLAIRENALRHARPSYPRGRGPSRPGPAGQPEARRSQDAEGDRGEKHDTVRAEDVVDDAAEPRTDGAAQAVADAQRAGDHRSE